MELDHIAVSAATLEEGIAHIETALGVPLAGGGQHAYMSTHNRVLGFGPSDYFEVIAIDPGAPPVAHPRWFRLDEFRGPPRLTNWICRVGDLEAALARAPKGSGRAVALSRGDFRWKMGVPEDGRLPYDDCFPALIEWQGGLKPQDRLADSGCRLTQLEVCHPEARAIRDLLPLTDPRVVFTEGAVPALRATIATPHGPRILE